MPLMERVATLIRANLNDLIDKAEEPEAMLKQIILDMQNQLMQVKTQVAIAIADQHLLARKQKEQEGKAAEWLRKAELAVSKGEDDLARAALDRSLACSASAAAFREQSEQQSVQAENLKTALRNLEQKLAEARLKAELLIAEHRRTRPGRAQQKISILHALGDGKPEASGTSLEDRIAALERQDQVERLLKELKTRKCDGC